MTLFEVAEIGCFGQNARHPELREHCDRLGEDDRTHQGRFRRRALYVGREVRNDKRRRQKNQYYAKRRQGVGIIIYHNVRGVTQGEQHVNENARAFMFCQNCVGVNESMGTHSDGQTP